MRWPGRSITKAAKAWVACGVLAMTLPGCGGSNDQGTSGGADGGADGGSDDAVTSSSCVDGSGSVVPPGGYRCLGGIGGHSILECQNGQLNVVATCDCTVSMGDPRKPPYATSCSYGSGSDDRVCEYAGVSCLECVVGSGCH